MRNTVSVAAYFVLDLLNLKQLLLPLTHPFVYDNSCIVNSTMQFVFASKYSLINSQQYKAPLLGAIMQTPSDFPAHSVIIQ